MLLTCGCGIAYDTYTGKDAEGNDNPYGPRYIYPIQVGVLADADGVYSFSCQIKMEVPYPVDLMILWYDTDGGVTGLHRQVHRWASGSSEHRLEGVPMHRHRPRRCGVRRARHLPEDPGG